MDYIRGPTIMQEVHQKGPMKEEEALKLFSQLIEILKYLHNQAGVCHRDINPNNLMLKPSDDY